MANEYLTRTLTSAGNRKVWTWCAWIKRNNIQRESYFSAGNGTNNSFGFDYTSSSPWIYDYSNGFDWQIKANKDLRDVGNFFHYQLTYDTTEGTSGDRVNIYINGAKISSFSTATYPSQNFEGYVNSLVKHNLGAYITPAFYSDVEFTDIFFVDGQALTPDVFGFYKDGDGYMSSGSSHATDFRPGQWMPHAPSKIKKDINRRGGFGVNGFYLPMNDSSNPGADFHCAPNSVITLKGEDLPQPRNGAPTTSDAFVSQVRKEIGGLGFAGCVKLDSNQGLSIADTAALDLGTGDFTIEGFYYFKPSTTGYPALFDGRGSGADGVVPTLFRDQNSDKLYYYVNSAVRIDNMPMRHNEWMHVAICRSSGTTRAFVDGALVGSFSDTFNYICRDLYIGQSASNSNDLFGFVSNFRIVKGSALYTADFTRPTAPLENVTNTILLCANSSTSATASTITPSTISTIGSPVATTSELTGSISLAVAGASTATGANLVTNGTFDTNTNGWTSEASATLSFEDGRLKVLTTNTSYGSANQTVTGLTVGQRYTFQTNMYYGNDSLVTVLSGAVSVNSGWQSADFLWTYSFTAGSTSLLIDLQMSSNTGKYGYWDNIILKEEGLPPDYSANIRGSGTNLTAISQGEAGIAYNIPSNYGSVMDFNTDSERLYYSLDGTSRGTNDFTMECWFYPTREANTWGIIMQHATNSSWHNGITVNARYGNSRQFTIYGHNGSNYHVVVDPRTNYEFNQWYHICAERHNDILTLYVNGKATAFTDVTGNNYSTADTPSNSSSYAFSLGAQSDGSYPSDGYITDVRVYDGVAKYKGGFDVPKPYTPVGIEAFRTTTDTCKNNFATFNLLKKSSNQTLSDGNLTCTQEGSVWGAASSTIGMDESSGKYYVEYRVRDTQYSYIGIANVDSLVFDLATVASGYSYMGATANDWGYLSSNGNLRHNDGNVQTGGAVLSAGDILGITFDTSNKEAKWYKNGALQYTQTLTGNYPFFFASGSYQSSNIVNFGQNPSFGGRTTAGTNADDSGKGLFKYAPPTGFLALCEDNLPTPAIADPGKHFKSVLYTGDGVAGRPITGVGFQPDFVWLKGRTSASLNHILCDSIRGPKNTLFTNNTLAQYTDRGLNSFDQDGFTLFSAGGDENNNSLSGAPHQYVAWCWKAGGRAVTNKDGALTSQVSVNRDAGFSIVKFTGQTSGTSTVGHGLGKKPAFWIYKPHTNTTGWYTYHQSLGASGWLQFDTTAATTGNAAAWGGVEPTSTVLTHGSGLINQGSCILYAWAEIEGYSRFGSYVGNGNADGTFVYCGFKPAWVLIKKINGSGNENWRLFDSSRCPTNPNNKHLLPSNGAAESTESGIDLLSNGFKLRHADAHQNQNGSTYIFAAFAESPFQTANAK